MDTMIKTRHRHTKENPCHRCHGMMAPESCINVHSDAGEVELLTWRCLQCGELIDPVILQNRANPPSTIGRRKPRPILPSGQRTSRKRTVTA